MMKTTRCGMPTTHLTGVQQLFSGADRPIQYGTFVAHFTDLSKAVMDHGPKEQRQIIIRYRETCATFTDHHSCAINPVHAKRYAALEEQGLHTNIEWLFDAVLSCPGFAR